MNDLIPIVIGGFDGLWGKQYKQGNRVYYTDSIAPCLNSQPQGHVGGYTYLIIVEEDE